MCELTHVLKLSQPKISRHLAQLRNHGLVDARRDGQWMYYQINPELPQWARLVLQQTLDGIGSSGQFSNDFKLLNDLKNQIIDTCCS